MIYLASPYAHQDKAVMQARFEAVCRKVAHYYKCGTAVYSPIAHNHPVAILTELPRTWDFWEKIDTPMLLLCSEMHILTLDGWDKSTGIAAETKIAEANGIPVTFVEQ